LDLKNTQVTGVGFEHLKDLPNFNQVYLGGSQVTKKGRQELRRAIPGLKIR